MVSETTTTWEGITQTKSSVKSMKLEKDCLDYTMGSMPTLQED